MFGLGAIQKELKGVADDLLGNLESNTSKKESPKTDMDKDLIEKKNAKAEKKRAKEEKLYQKERQKQRVEGQYKREKLREEMRLKYGLSKPSTSDKVDFSAIESVQREYKLSDQECNELQKSVHEQEMERRNIDRKVEKKLEKRKQKKEIKESVKGACNTQ